MLLSNSWSHFIWSQGAVFHLKRLGIWKIPLFFRLEISLGPYVDCTFRVVLIYYSYTHKLVALHSACSFASWSGFAVTRPTCSVVSIAMPEDDITSSVHSLIWTNKRDADFTATRSQLQAPTEELSTGKDGQLETPTGKDVIASPIRKTASASQPMKTCHHPELLLLSNGQLLPIPST